MPPAGKKLFAFLNYWRRHKLIALTLLAASMLALRLAWGWYTARQVVAILADIRSRGEPATTADVFYPVLPDSDNAFVLLSQAAKALAYNVDSPRSSNLEYPDYPPFGPDWIKLAEASEKANSQAFALTRQASALPKAQFAHWWVSPMARINLANLDLANKVGDGALYAHVQGNDEEAVARLMDGMHLGLSIAQDDSLVSQLVAMGCEALACNSAQAIAPGLHIEPANAEPPVPYTGTRPAKSRPASRNTVKDLINLLLDERAVIESRRRAILNERLAMIESINMLSSDSWLICPLGQRQLVRDLPNYQTSLEAVGSSTWPQAQLENYVPRAWLGELTGLGALWHLCLGLYLIV